jgi:hypothetical protein
MMREAANNGVMIAGRAGAVPAPEVAVAFADEDRLRRFVTAISADPSVHWPALIDLGDAGLEDLTGGRGVSRIYFGNEFCERLLPSQAVADSVAKLVNGAGLAFSLATPTLSDDGLDAMRALLASLPAGSEVSVNDWGLMRAVRRDFPGLRMSAGRLLCKMLKEPRAPSAEWMELGGHGFMSPGFEVLLARLNVDRVEIDLAPFVRIDDLRAPATAVSVYVPFGFATTGRICRIGSVHQPVARKFSAGHNCARECLTYLTEMEPQRETSSSEMRPFQRGNTVFYRHTPAMSAVLAGALAAGMADRIIVSGDWNEARRPNLCA